MRIVFLGTPEFAVPSLRALINTGHEIPAVFTQPDRPKGRGNQLSESPVKVTARQFGLPVFQPERIRRPEQLELLKTFGAEMMVVVGYGQIIPQSIIDLPRFGILNVHASLLPKYRGAAPIQWAIANGETITGVTIMQIDAGLDTGDMLLKSSLSIGADETAPELSLRLAPLGADLLVKAITSIKSGTIAREKQNDAEATFAPILKKEDGEIRWSRTAGEIYNRLRGFTPWPGAYTAFRGQQLSVLHARPAGESSAGPGRLRPEKRRLLAGCGEGTALELLEVQIAGKKRMSVEAFLNGYKPGADEALGDQQ
ncbi:MAG: methionyl-tRNA formyltransferase [Acidobacteriaceae bacterium]|nr:methionyl-tRNA formyltransferase [Acidobacteriaceae bacterium]